MSAYNLSMGRKRSSQTQGGQPKKQKKDPNVKIRKSRTQKKISSNASELYNCEGANYNLVQWVSTFENLLSVDLLNYSFIATSQR